MADLRRIFRGSEGQRWFMPGSGLTVIVGAAVYRGGEKGSTGVLVGYLYVKLRPFIL